MTILLNRIFLVSVCCVANSLQAEDGHARDSGTAGSTVIRKDVLESISRFFPEPNTVDPVKQYGTAVLPVVTDLLSEPEQITPHRADGALEILRDVGQTYQQAVPTVQQYLRASAWHTREVAVGALAAVGSQHELPIFVTMLYDSKDTVRYQAVVAIGKFGEKSSLTAFAIWRAQAAAADEHRPEPEKWVDGTIRNAMDHASAMIRDRIAKEEIQHSQLPLNTPK